MKRRNFRSAYYSLYYRGSRIACYFNYCDLVDYVRRSVAAGCSSEGWMVRLVDGSYRRIVCEVYARVDFW